MYASITRKGIFMEQLIFKYNNIILSSYLTISISVLTLIVLLFILMPQE